MHSRGLLLLFLAPLGACLPLLAQEAAQAPPPPPPAEAKKPVVLEKPAYVRRISAGVTGGYLILDLMRPEEVDQPGQPGGLRTRSTGDSKAKKYTAGVTVNLALTERWAVNVMGLMKWSGYNMQNQFFVTRFGTERLEFTTQESTRARYYDVPILIKRYNIDRHEQGWRWFYGVGPTARFVNNIRTSITEQVTGQEAVCCKTDAAAPSKRWLYGATGGIGMQFIDDFGIRFVPEVRYTRWFGATWDRFAAQSNRHQVEVLISFTF
jgi:hypothetical protein